MRWKRVEVVPSSVCANLASSGGECANDLADCEEHLDN
jgi:hypothetical protein